jgi:hypothetical protein
MSDKNGSATPGGRPSGRRGQTATIRHYHLDYLRDLGDKIGTADISECLNFALNLLRSGQSIQPINAEAATEVKTPIAAPAAALNETALVSALHDLF